MINYIIKAKKSPITGKEKFYPQIAEVLPVKLDQLCEEMAEESTITRHDIKAVLSSLQSHIIRHLQAGQSVRLGDLGSFRPTIKADGAEDKTKVNASLIKAVRVRFTKSGLMDSEFNISNRNITFSKNGTGTAETSGTTPNP